MGAEQGEEGERYREMQRRADRVCSLIVGGDYPAIDVVIEIRRLREFCEEHFADRMELFEQVYEGRFKRLWAQYRYDSDEQLPEW